MKKKLSEIVRNIRSLESEPYVFNKNQTKYKAVKLFSIVFTFYCLLCISWFFNYLYNNRYTIGSGGEIPFIIEIGVTIVSLIMLLSVIILSIIATSYFMIYSFNLIKSI